MKCRTKPRTMSDCKCSLPLLKKLSSFLKTFHLVKMIALLVIFSPSLTSACFTASLASDSVHFFFIDYYGKEPPHIVTDVSDLYEEDYDENKLTVVLIHDYGECFCSESMKRLIEAYDSFPDYNIIVVDWRKGAEAPGYLTASKNTYSVGQVVADFLKNMIVELDHDMGWTEIVGFGLGAHVAGVAGYTINAKPSRIIGLDPAKHMFLLVPLKFRLDSSDAKLVEVVHTASGIISLKRSLGHRDYYPNGGFVPQPGCSPDILGVCSHKRAYEYFAEAVENYWEGYVSIQCFSWLRFQLGKCQGNPTIAMANDNLDSNFGGSFYLTTRPSPPYAR